MGATFFRKIILYSHNFSIFRDTEILFKAFENVEKNPQIPIKIRSKNIFFAGFWGIIFYVVRQLFDGRVTIYYNYKTIIFLKTGIFLSKVLKKYWFYFVFTEIQ